MPRFHTLCIALLAIIPTMIISAEPVADIKIPQGDPEALTHALESRGWHVEKDSNGDLLVYPGSRGETTPPPASEKAKTPGATDLVNETGDLDELEAMAKRRGWTVQRNAAGDLLLYPSTFISDAADKKEAPAKKSELATPAVDSKINATELDRLEDALRKKGWQVERDAGGDLLLYPAAAEGKAAETSSLTLHVARFSDCTTNAKDIIYPTTLSLPIRHKADAKKIAREWLTVFGKDTETVGRIQRVNRLFIVSIVSTGKPHTLLRQLVINQRTGNSISVP